jgi:hypothetical protein
MNTWEKFYIHKLSKNNLQMNDTYTDINNPIFDLIDNHHNKKNQYQPLTPHLTTPLPQTYPTPPNANINTDTHRKHQTHIQCRQHTNHGKGKRLIYILQGKRNIPHKKIKEGRHITTTYVVSMHYIIIQHHYIRTYTNMKKTYNVCIKMLQRQAIITGKRQKPPLPTARSPRC